MKLGFVTAILPDLSFEDVLKFAADQGFGCVEVMCWPVGAAERRYAGVTHLDVSNFGPAEAANVKALVAKYGVSISGLGYYPNPLAADPIERGVYVEHIKKVIAAAKMIDVPVMNTFVGRDPARSIEDQWPLFEETWARSSPSPSSRTSRSASRTVRCCSASTNGRAVRTSPFRRRYGGACSTASPANTSG